MLKELSGGELPDWNYGNIMIKTYSYGHSLQIAEMLVVSSKSVVDGKEVVEYAVKDGYKDSDVNLMILAAGVHFVRDKDGNRFALSPEVDIDAKKKFVFNFDRTTAIYLLNQIKELNGSIGEELKKKSN